MTWNSGLPSMFAAPRAGGRKAALRLVLDLLLAEGVRLVGEVAAEDDRVRPDVAHDVRGEVRRERGLEALLAERERRERRERDVVLDDLAPRLARHPLELLDELLLRLLALAIASRSRSWNATPHSKNAASTQVVERLRQVDRVPLLVRVDPHDLVAEVLVLAADVRVRVVHVVVGVLPRLGRRRRVPVPRRGVDVRVVHPVPLAVHDVVADLHVLEDLGQRQRRRSRRPRPACTSRRRGGSATPRARRRCISIIDDDVRAVAVAEVGEDLVVDRVELLAELLDLLVAEPGERALDHGGSAGLRARSRLRPRGR